MAFDKTWNEADPAGGGNVSSGDDKFRDLQYGLRERLAIDHNTFATEAGETNIACHKKISLIESTVAPTTDTTLGFVYVKAVSGVLELFYKDSDGNELQMTDNGSLVGTTAFRTGDWIISETTAARSGWTDISATYENKFIRISSGTPLATGGVDTHTHTAGSFSASAHTHTATVSTATGTAYSGDSGTSVLTHTHTVTLGTGGGGAVSGTAASGDNVPAYVQLRIWRKD